MMANMTAIGILIGISAESKDTPIEKGLVQSANYRMDTESETQPQLSAELDKLEELGSVEEVSVEQQNGCTVMMFQGKSDTFTLWESVVLE